MIPLWSALTLATELAVTACVVTIIWRAYRTGTFMGRFALGVLAYELVFNVSYMATREAHAITKVINPYWTGIAIFHGIFSLVMFIALIAFFAVGYRKYAAGENYFATHHRLTVVFVSAWSVSIISGIALFANLYLF